MARLMDLGMSSVNQTLIEMGDIAERTLQIALDSYFKNDGSRKKVLELSEELRGLADEISDISDIAVELVARYQPVAKDLRLIRASMEIAYIFWRLGRYTYDIIDTIEILNPVLDSDCDKTTVMKISYIVGNVMELGLLSLKNKDETIVEKLYEMDSTVDTLYRKYLRDTINTENTDIWGIHSRCYISNILILKYLERISDHVCYLGDCVTYLVTGRSSPRR
jgi:phosphate transport system protein